MKDGKKSIWSSTVETAYLTLILMGIWIGVTYALMSQEVWPMKPNEIGDSFGMVTSLFTGFAALFAIKAFTAQKAQVDLLASANLIQILPRLIDDELAAIMLIHEDIGVVKPTWDMSEENLKFHIDEAPDLIKTMREEAEMACIELEEIKENYELWLAQKKLTPAAGIRRRKDLSDSASENTREKDCLFLSLPRYKQMLKYKIRLRQAVETMM